jgi:hypothetical protein
MLSRNAYDHIALFTILDQTEPPNAPAQRRAEQRTVRCNRLLGACLFDPISHCIYKGINVYVL